MAFEPGQAVVVTDEAHLAQYGRAFRKVGKSIVVVPLTTGIHAGHISLIRAARSLLGAYVFVIYQGTPGEPVPEDFAREGVDVVFHGELATTARIHTGLDHLEDADSIAHDTARIIAAANLTHATDLVMGEKDFELLVATQLAVTSLRMEVKLHSVPTVRMPDGIAISLRNADVPEAQRDAALALSAALTAGAHAAEHGEKVVLDTARGVLEAAGLTPAYLALRDLAFRPAPETGDARLLAAVDLGGVHLIDNVGLPLGVGFKHIEASPENS
ncbi:Pantothenate synthetase [Corynebacterium glaucum]|uniref:pantoate--beta-alanine ligase n=1 Tax=Corynebacterium glaucum TaxID=187491 RepID=UPI0025B29453|nr:pantoate--beta-alanine ligase [Corynebacterium glaucum]WJZ08568.1 Pantothenate synthetase [Corynebacterium glaucum]